MTTAHLFAGLVTVIGAAAFIGTMIWTLDREDEAFQEAITKPRLAPRPAPSTPKPSTALETTTPEALHN